MLYSNQILIFKSKSSTLGTKKHQQKIIVNFILFTGLKKSHIFTNSIQETSKGRRIVLIGMPEVIFKRRLHKERKKNKHQVRKPKINSCNQKR